MGKRQIRVSPAGKHRSLRCGAPVASVCRCKPPKIVETDLRLGKSGKLAGGGRIEITQQSIADALIGQRMQLFLAGFERLPERWTASKRLRNVEPGCIKPHREQAGEPAHRAR